jgi:hypothetical protein
LICKVLKFTCEGKFSLRSSRITLGGIELAAAKRLSGFRFTIGYDEAVRDEVGQRQQRGVAQVGQVIAETVEHAAQAVPAEGRGLGAA